MMNKEFIKKQINSIGLNTNVLKGITGIGYATLNDYLNKDIYNISAKHYTTIIDTLFTSFEQLLYRNAQLKSISSNYDYEYWFEELKKRKIAESIETGKITVERSGAPYSNSDGTIKTLPVHIIVTFNDVEGKNSVRIFDKTLYNNLNNQGKKDKVELIKQHFEL